MKVLVAALAVSLACADPNANPSTDRQPESQWEYGQLTVGHAPSAPPEHRFVAGWSAGDSMVVVSLLARQRQYPPDRGPAPLVIYLNELGSQGWELVAMTGNLSDGLYLFKRSRRLNGAGQH